MAEAMARKLLDGRGRSDIEVASAGTSTAGGLPASEGAYLVALEHGMDLSGHTSTPLGRAVVEGADLVLAMGRHHVDRVEALGGEGKTFLLGEYAGRNPYEAEVEDPFGGDIEEYRRTWDQLAELLRDAVERLVGESDAGPGGGRD